MWLDGGFGMAIGIRPHPLERLTWSDRLRWARERRQILRAVDAFQLQILRSAADRGTEVYSVVAPYLPDPRPTDCRWPGARLRAVEVALGERRLAGRVSSEALVRMETAVRAGRVRLVGAGRYGPYWTFVFDCLEPRGHAGESLVVLADRVVLLPGAGGTATDRRAPALQFGG
jgi:hypothetical protein